MQHNLTTTLEQGDARAGITGAPLGVTATAWYHWAKKNHENDSTNAHTPSTTIPL